MKWSRAFLCLSVALACGCGHKEQAVKSHDPYPWEGERWSTDIVIEGPQDDQDAVRSFLYYLRKNVGPDKLDPFGGTNDTYKGHVFWDADVWIFPALALVDPEKAKAIPDFRLRTAAHAQFAYLKAHPKEYPGVTGPDWKLDPHLPLRYPWESDSEGNDVTEGPTKKEEHVSGDVGWGLSLATALGLADSARAYDVGASIGFYYQKRSDVRSDDGRLEIRNVTGVDEWFEGDNCLYTNAIAEWAGNWYLTAGDDYYIPRNTKGEVVAYEGDPERSYSQAAAPLILWPLEWTDLAGDPIKFLDRFEGKESPNGPAMSLSVYALIRARYGNADTAYKTWRESWKKYTTGNSNLEFSERPGRKDLTYFDTGAAGCLNAVIYGFMGAHIVEDATNDKAKIALNDDRWLVFRPNLPAAWRRVTFKGMQVLGHRYTVVCEGRRATVAKDD